jgi:uncharacterized metal-binding protein
MSRSNDIQYPQTSPVEIPDHSTEQTTEIPTSRTVVYSCSGCSDTGALSDLIARSLAKKNLARMSCLAGIGGRVKSIMSNASNAHRILVIDGCPIECAKRTMLQAGFYNFRHLNLHDVGKGASPVTTRRINAGVKAAKTLIERY